VTILNIAAIEKIGTVPTIRRIMWVWTVPFFKKSEATEDEMSEEVPRAPRTTSRKKLIISLRG